MSKATAKDLKRLIECQEYRCALTGRLLEPETASCDHKIPLSNGGTSEIGNLWIVHTEVNKAKGVASIEAFIAMCCEVADWSRLSEAERETKTASVIAPMNEKIARLEAELLAVRGSSGA